MNIYNLYTTTLKAIMIKNDDYVYDVKDITTHTNYSDGNDSLKKLRKMLISIKEPKLTLKGA